MSENQEKKLSPVGSSEKIDKVHQDHDVEKHHYESAGVEVAEPGRLKRQLKNRQ
jgi:hypothetical protein